MASSGVLMLLTPVLRVFLEVEVVSISGDSRRWGSKVMEKDGDLKGKLKAGLMRANRESLRDA